MDFAEGGSLQEFLVGATIEIRENGSRITAISPLSWEVRGESGKPLLHLWAENCNVTRRVLAIADHSDSRMSLAVERFGRIKPERMEIVRVEFLRGARQLRARISASNSGASWLNNSPMKPLSASPSPLTWSIPPLAPTCAVSPVAEAIRAPFSRYRKANCPTPSKVA